MTWRRPSPLTIAIAGVLAAIVLVAGILGGCGHTGVAPSAWAKSVCSALLPWRTQIADLTTQAQREMGGAKTAAQAKQALTTLLGGAERASEGARRAVLAAGVPDVSGGAAIAARFVTSLEHARDAYGHAKTTIVGLDTGQAKRFYDAVEVAFDKLKTEYAASALDTGKVGSGPLQRAFDEVPECR